MEHPFVQDMLAGMLNHIDNDGRTPGEPGTHTQEYFDTVFELYQASAHALMKANADENENQWKFLELVVIPRLKALPQRDLFTPNAVG